MKQLNIFGAAFAPQSEDQKYSNKIEAPIYEPKNDKPHTLELYDQSKTMRLMREIEASNVGPEEKVFLREAARRHTVFNYERIADYYAHASPEMQELMEKSALVIIDFDDAVQNGYVKLCEEIRKNYLEDYEEQ